jgi:hypothetical protein
VCLYLDLLLERRPSGDSFFAADFAATALFLGVGVVLRLGVFDLEGVALRLGAAFEGVVLRLVAFFAGVVLRDFLPLLGSGSSSLEVASFLDAEAGAFLVDAVLRDFSCFSAA